MATNPNPARIPDAIWWLWEQLKALEPTSQLGGIYANKSGYHNTRAANEAGWPGNYSIRLPEDMLGPLDKASALDWTFPDAQSGNYARIAKYGKRLLDSGKDPNDPRGNYLREAYFQADFDLQVEGWDYYFVRAASSDASHLWHIHFSFLRKYCTSMEAMKAVLSILKGETVAQWRSGEEIMAISDEDAKKIAKAVWDIDYIPSPNVDSRATNPTWAAKNVIAWGGALDHSMLKQLATLIDYDKLAERVVAKLPAQTGTSELSKGAVKEALAEVLREGVDTVNSP